MRGGELIREARKRRNLSQRELADLLGTTQSVITRWETGERSPTYERLIQAIRACGLDLYVRVVTPDEGHALLIDRNLRLNPGERLDRATEAMAAQQNLIESVTRR